MNVKNSKTYTGWQIPDYSSGKRIRHQRATLEEAKAKAREVCEALAGNRKEVLAWDDAQRFGIQRALVALQHLDVGIDRAATIFAEAAKVVAPEEIVAACRSWHEKRPNQKLTPQFVDETVEAFLERRSQKVSARRHKADSFLLGTFREKFTRRLMHEITTVQLKDWADSRRWAPATRNRVIGLIKRLYRDAIERGYAADNPADAIKSERVGDTDIGIFTPEQVRRIMESVDDEVKAFFALLFFSGLRKEEASRLTLEQVRDGVKSGSIFVTASMTKTNRKRSITICPNLKAWLLAYLPLKEDFIPARLRTAKGLDALSKYAPRKSGVPWVANGPRHSFATYHLRLHGDAAQTVKEMGNSLEQLDNHYSSRSDAVTREVAVEYFGIMPQPAGLVISLASAKAA